MIYDRVWFCEWVSEQITCTHSLTHRTPDWRSYYSDSWTFLAFLLGKAGAVILVGVVVFECVRRDLYESLNSSFVECRLKLGKKKEEAANLRRIPNGAEPSHQATCGVGASRSGVSLCRDEQILNSSSLSAYQGVCYISPGAVIFFFLEAAARGGGGGK